MKSDIDPVREAVDGGSTRLLCVGGPLCGESLSFPSVWDGCLAPRQKMFRHFFHAGNTFRESKEAAGLPVNPMMDRRHRYARATWRGREVLLHSEIEGYE